MSELTVTKKFHVRRQAKGRKQIAAGGPPTSPADGVPRVSRLLALAIRFDELVRNGEVADFAELARLGHVTRARLTQITNLLNLAPDIQDEILHLSRVKQGRQSISERDLRPIAAVADWEIQRAMWARARFPQ